MITGEWIERFIKKNYLNFEVRFDAQRNLFGVWTGDTWFYAKTVEEAVRELDSMTRE